jgi:DegV family protein with EDD domain
MIAIVTDSTICIPQSEAEALGIRVVPNGYGVNGHIYAESFSDQNGDFEKRIFAPGAQCGTSQARVTAFGHAFRELIRAGHDVLCIVLSSRLSGTYSSACIAAREVDGERIAVVDSLTTAGGLLLLAKRARALAARGFSLQEAAQAVTKLRERVGIAFSVDDMSALRRSGRLGLVPQSIGTVLNIRPILLCTHGTVVARGLARGAAGRVRELIDRVPADAKEIIVHHMGDPSSAESLRSGLKKSFPSLEVGLYRLGPVLGVHLGRGTLGVAWISE